MPTPEPTLSEWLLEWVGDYGPGKEGVSEKFREAARLLVPFAQPEVAELILRAEELEGGYSEIIDNAEALARDLRSWARGLVELAEAQAKVKRVEELRNEWNSRGIGEPGCGPLRAGKDLQLRRCIDELDDALTGAGGERKVTG